MIRDVAAISDRRPRAAIGHGARPLRSDVVAVAAVVTARPFFLCLRCSALHSDFL